MQNIELWKDRAGRKASLLFLLIVSSLDCAWAQDSSDAEQYLLGLYKQERYEEVVEGADSLFKTTSKENSARLYQIKADALYFLNDVSYSLENYLLTIQTLDPYQIDTVYLLEAYSHTGFCYVRLGKSVEALPYYERALRIALGAYDSIEISNQLSHLGTIFNEVGRFEKAKSYLDRAYAIDFALQDSTALAYDLVNLGDLMMNLGQSKTALEYYRQGLRQKKTRAGNHNTHVLRLGKLGSAYLKDNQLDSALKYNDLAIKEALVLNDSLSLAKQWIVQALILEKMGAINKAEGVGLLAYDYFQKTQAPKFLVKAGEALVAVYRRSSRLQKSLNVIEKILNVAFENQLLSDLSEIQLQKAEVLEGLRRPVEALQSFKAYQVIRDTLQKRQQFNTTLILDREYQTAKKEQEIALLKAKDQVLELQLQNRRRIIMMLVVAFVFTVAIGLFIIWANRRKSLLKNQLLSSEVSELRIRLKGLLEFQPEEIGVVKEQINKSLSEPLSEREFEILNLALSDKSNPEIAEEVFVSVHTVKFHLRNVYAKLGVANRKEALKYAVSLNTNLG